MVLVTQNTAHLSTSFNGNVIKLPTVGSMFVKYFQLTSHTFSKKIIPDNFCPIGKIDNVRKSLLYENHTIFQTVRHVSVHQNKARLCHTFAHNILKCVIDIPLHDVFLLVCFVCWLVVDESALDIGQLDIVCQTLVKQNLYCTSVSTEM